MLKLDIVKESDSGIFVPHGTVVHAGSTYELLVDAPEFAAHQGDSASFCLSKDGLVAASCDLLNDPLRRTRRIGILRTGDLRGEAEMHVVLGDSVLFSHPVSVKGVAGQGEEPPVPSGRWMVVDLGTVDSGSVSVSDLAQVTLSASGVAADLDVSTPSGPFEAYVAITGTSGRFPFDGILVNGAVPFWEHMDSLALAEEYWTLRLVGVAGVVHADLRAGRPSGTESDPDGDLVTSTEVNE